VEGGERGEGGEAEGGGEGSEGSKARKAREVREQEVEVTCTELEKIIIFQVSPSPASSRWSL
jgi:hypothetical protein